MHDENPHKAPSSTVSFASEDSVAESTTSTAPSFNEAASIVSDTSTSTVIPSRSQKASSDMMTERKQVLERLRERMANRPRPDYMDFMSSGPSTVAFEGPRQVSDNNKSQSDAFESDNEKVVFRGATRDISSPPNTSAQGVVAQSSAVDKSQPVGNTLPRSRLPAFLERPRSLLSASSIRSTPTSIRAGPPLIVPPPPIIYSASKSTSTTDVEMASPKTGHASSSTAQAVHSPASAQSVDAQSIIKDLEEIKDMITEMRNELKKSTLDEIQKLSTAKPSTPIQLPLAHPPMPPLPVPMMHLPVLPPPPPPPPVSVPVPCNLPPLPSLPPPPKIVPMPCNMPPLPVPTTLSSSYSPSYIVPPPPPTFAKDASDMTTEKLERLVSSTRAVLQQHNGVSCDGCDFVNIVGVRFKCLQCEGMAIDD